MLTVTFFMSVQLNYNGKTKRCLPKYDFPNCYDVTFTPNHWSNFENCVSLFQKIIFPYLKAKKEQFGYSKEHQSLIVIKGQDNALKGCLKELCSQNECELVTHNLTSKFQHFDITIIQKAKKFISHKLNTWYRDRVSNQLKHGVAPGNG